MDKTPLYTFTGIFIIIFIICMYNKNIQVEEKKVFKLVTFRFPLKHLVEV